MSGESVGVPVRRSRSGIVEALNREWILLVRAHRGTAIRWGAAHGALAGCESLEDVVLRATEEPDAVLAALLAEVAKQDQVAARTVLQSMIGRIVRMAWRDYGAGVDDYLSALWCVIASYPLARRPTRIPANLSMEALKLVSGERRWLRRGQVSLWPHDELVDAETGMREMLEQPSGLGAVQIIDTALELGLIDDAASALLSDVYIDELNSSEAAMLYRSTTGAIRVRCSRAVRHLTEHATELAEAA